MSEAMPATEMDLAAPLIFTDSAAQKVKQLIEEEKNDALKLRVFVSGGGCSGFQYGFTLTKKFRKAIPRLRIPESPS